MYRFAAGLSIVLALLVSTHLVADDTPAKNAAEVTPKAEVDSAAAFEGTPPTTDEHGAAAVHNQGGDVHAAESHDVHHDPTDLSHLNASPQIEDPSQFRSDLAIWTFVVFLCLLLILGKFAWGPIMEGLEKREQSIATMIEEAKLGQAKAAEQLKQYEAKLAAAGEEARELVAQARRDAESAKDRILAEAQQAADRQRQRAIEDIQVAKNVALQEITATSVNLAVDLAGRIVRQQLNAEDHSQLIREAMNQLPSHN